MLVPTLPGESLAPTTATERGASKGSSLLDGFMGLGSNQENYARGICGSLRIIESARRLGPRPDRREDRESACDLLGCEPTVHAFPMRRDWPIPR